MSKAETERAEGARIVAGAGGDMLLLSMRRLSNLVANCLPYEFEDVFAELTGADRAEAGDMASLERSRRAYKLTYLATHCRALANAIAPRPATVRLERDYDLFFATFNNAWELFALAAVPGWRTRCRKAACFVSEIWSQELPDYLLRLLSEFDHVFIGVVHAVEEVARIVGRPCSYLPLAVDVLRFAPRPDQPYRFIDVCNIGRRSKVTHAALVAAAQAQRLFYFYDTVSGSGTEQKERTFQVENANEHRLLLSAILQRSRYFVANRARVNEPEYTRGRDEISGRFYEGAAAGAVLIGEAPRIEEFARQFDWPDAVIPLPFDSPDVVEILTALDGEPERLERARLANMRGAALRHDWVYRLLQMFEALGLTPTEAMQARAARLEALAASLGPGPSSLRLEAG